ncbi:MAG: hypothetical protein BSOLF_2548 [Candidatus Carbobacillus altaicus]|uniref:Uncharacterized protein n=1 Tax=Candidatus Carbonibacillus altaicus TaxID=2163959 RepID=A0A2R6XX87_9BACL|nr:MAG: hypothetical protein BSOLF_0958 [Candidatus Carbobacillus altaicus]PTQ56872.1 MAG: hypothetical protein BSOLF_2548 [Candidatus Carbobacillus altaicus]
MQVSPIINSFLQFFGKMAAVVDDKPFGGVGLEVKEEA